MNAREAVARLAAYRWNKRLLLVFGAADEEAVAAQARLLKGHDGALRARDLVVLVPAGAEEAALRERFKVPVGVFAALLVGKDGGEKARFFAPVSLQEVARRVDAMPMRRREMGER